MGIEGSVPNASYHILCHYKLEMIMKNYYGKLHE